MLGVGGIPRLSLQSKSGSPGQRHCSVHRAGAGRQELSPQTSGGAWQTAKRPKGQGRGTHHYHPLLPRPAALLSGVHGVPGQATQVPTGAAHTHKTAGPREGAGRGGTLEPTRAARSTQPTGNWGEGAGCQTSLLAGCVTLSDSLSLSEPRIYISEVDGKRVQTSIKQSVLLQATQELGPSTTSASF